MLSNGQTLALSQVSLRPERVSLTSETFDTQQSGFSSEQWSCDDDNEKLGKLKKQYNAWTRPGLTLTMNQTRMTVQLYRDQTPNTFDAKYLAFRAIVRVSSFGNKDATKMIPRSILCLMLWIVIIDSAR